MALPSFGLGLLFPSWGGGGPSPVGVRVGPSFSGLRFALPSWGWGLAHPFLLLVSSFHFSLFLQFLLLLAQWFCFLLFFISSFFATFHSSSFLVLLCHGGSWPFLLGPRVGSSSFLWAGPSLTGVEVGPSFLGVGWAFGFGLALPFKWRRGYIRLG